LDCSGPLEITRRVPGPSADGRIVLGAEFAVIHNSRRTQVRLAGKGDEARITKWTNPEACVSWEFNTPKAGTFLVKADIAGKGGGKLDLLLGTGAQAAKIPVSKTSVPRTVELGTISVVSPGGHTLELKPDKDDWKGLELHNVTLTPVKQGPLEPSA